MFILVQMNTIIHIFTHKISQNLWYGQKLGGFMVISDRNQTSSLSFFPQKTYEILQYISERQSSQNLYFVKLWAWHLDFSSTFIPIYSLKVITEGFAHVSVIAWFTHLKWFLKEFIFFLFMLVSDFWNFRLFLLWKPLALTCPQHERRHLTQVH